MEAISSRKICPFSPLLNQRIYACLSFWWKQRIYVWVESNPDNKGQEGKRDASEVSTAKRKIRLLLVLPDLGRWLYCTTRSPPPGTEVCLLGQFRAYKNGVSFLILLSYLRNSVKPDPKKIGTARHGTILVTSRVAYRTTTVMWSNPSLLEDVTYRRFSLDSWRQQPSARLLLIGWDCGWVALPYHLQYSTLWFAVGI